MYFNKTPILKQYNIKLVTLIFILLFINFLIWSLIHSVHHIGSKLNFSFSKNFSKYEHIHPDGNIHQHVETSSPKHKKHQEQADIECLLAIFIVPEEKFLSTRSTTLKKLNEFNYGEKIFPNIDLIKIYYLISSYIPRGPPIS